jgi:hypothetical protein
MNSHFLMYFSVWAKTRWHVVQLRCLTYLQKKTNRMYLSELSNSLTLTWTGLIREIL